MSLPTSAWVYPPKCSFRFFYSPFKPSADADADDDGSTNPADTLAVEAVMDPKIQDPLMTASYDGLPHIAAFADVSPYGYDLQLGGYSARRAELSNVAKTMCKKDFQYVFVPPLFVLI